jgi:hypothetical protein
MQLQKKCGYVFKYLFSGQISLSDSMLIDHSLFFLHVTKERFMLSACLSLHAVFLNIPNETIVDATKCRRCSSICYYIQGYLQCRNKAWDSGDWWNGIQYHNKILFSLTGDCFFSLQSCMRRDSKSKHRSCHGNPYTSCSMTRLSFVQYENTSHTCFLLKAPFSTYVHFWSSNVTFFGTQK